MANIKVLAYPYAQALFKVATQKQCQEQWLAVLADLASLITNPDFCQALNNPKVSRDQILAAIQTCLVQTSANNVDPEIINLLQVLAENKRLLAMGEIYAIFHEIVWDAQQRSTAVIESAYELSGAELEQLEQLLSNKFGKKIAATVKLNSELMAGIKITVNDKVIDGSVKGRLTALATQLTQ